MVFTGQMFINEFNTKLVSYLLVSYLASCSDIYWSGIYWSAGQMSDWSDKLQDPK
jgi:hypothetical protein